MKLLCESVCFSYSGKQWIFEDYNRVFTSGITILKGYSGCGKTTLLKILAGYLSPQRGRVITPRRKVQADSLYRRKEVSYMFQGLNLLPLATVERNLQLCAEMAMLPKKQWTRRADDLITRLGLESLRHKKAGSLSGGQAQRLALARTLAHPRPLMILDDPFSALDRKTEDTVFANLQDYAKDKVVFLISHRLYHFPQMQKVIFMEDGKTTVGTHGELMASVPAYRRFYESQTGGEQHEEA